MGKESTATPNRSQQFKSDIDDEQTLKILHNRLENGETHLRPLINGLQILQELFPEIFNQIDKNALDYQRWYRLLAFGSTLTGSIAVLMALLQLALAAVVHKEYDIVAFAELTFAGLSLLLVLSVILKNINQKWLLKRIQAERLRLNKFDAMLDRSFWESSEHEHLKSKLTREIDSIQLESEDKIEEWARNHPAPRIHSAPKEIDRKLAEEFRTYYLETRLNTQLQYLKKKYPAERKSNNGSKYAGPLTFYVSVVAVLVHFFLTHGGNSPNEVLLIIFIALAIGLPAFGATVRIHRDTREYGRNSLRHHATYNALLELRRQLEEEKTANGVFRIVGFCEHVLESDTREWTRLFSEAEWFG